MSASHVEPSRHVRTAVVALGAAVAALLLWSRYGLLANGPWEWDESNFARGLVDFDLAAHFPHPPGFPGWIAIGKAMRWIVPEPLTALQIASATASLVTVVLMVLAARRLAPTAVAVASAVLVAFLPGVWLHAVRGFASTTATALGLGAAVVLLAPFSRTRLTVAAALVTAAALVRPQLAPVVAALWIGGAVRATRVRDLLPGVALGTAMTAVAAAAMAHASGGWDALAAAFVDHGGRHMSRLAWNRPTVAGLGFVKGLGGLGPATVVAVLAAVGLDHWRRRRGLQEAAVVALVVLLLAVELVFLHNRTYTRYSVPLLVALGPLVAVGVARLIPSRTVAAAVLGTGAAVAFATSLPLMLEQHRDRLPGFAAVAFAHDMAARNNLGVVEEASLHPLVSYHWHAQRELTRRAGPPLVLSPWAPEPWVGIDGHVLVVTDHRPHYLGPLVAGAARWTGPSERLTPFTQQRMLDASVIADPPLPVGRWWPVETTPDGESFMWGGTQCAYDLPPLPPDTRLVLELAPAPGPAPLEIRIDAEPIDSVAGAAGLAVVVIPPTLVPAGRPFRLGFRRARGYAPGSGDDRPLAVQIRSLKAVGPHVPWGGSVASERDRDRLGVTLEGAWASETFGRHGTAAWIRPDAELHLPTAPGTLTLRAWSPRSVAAHARAVLPGGRTVPLDLAATPRDLHVEILSSEAGFGDLAVRLASDAFVPAEHDSSSSDRRELGFVVSEVAFSPPGMSPRPLWWAGGELALPDGQSPPTP